MVMRSATQVASDFYLPAPIAVLLAQEGIEEGHLYLLIEDSNVLRTLHHFDQVRRDVSANSHGELNVMLHRITLAQQSVVSFMHHAWQNYPHLQMRLKNMEVQLAVIDALLCTQP